MPQYASGAIVLADARQRLRKHGTSFGILVVEGGDESRLLRRHAELPDLILPCGGKSLLLSAFEQLRPFEETRIAFLVDCDYDVPLGRLPRGPNLFITTHPAIETDLLATPGVVDGIAEELVDQAR